MFRLPVITHRALLTQIGNSQARAKVTDADIKAFMDGSRQIVPTFGKSKTAAEAPAAAAPAAAAAS